VIAPSEPGDYRLVWDVVHESRAWFSTEGVTPAVSAVHVEGAPTAPVKTVMAHLPGVTIRATRVQLWRAGWAMTRDHPWLGVGPDNFRLMYGPYAGIETPDPRVHANSMYDDVLAGAGLNGHVALLFLVTASIGALVLRTRAATGELRIAHAAFLCAAVVIAGHGLVDSFLGFTTTYLTFAIVAGLAFSDAFAAAPDAPVHRTEPSAPVAPDVPGHADRL
jgi:O-antigen ligase